MIQLEDMKKIKLPHIIEFQVIVEMVGFYL